MARKKRDFTREVLPDPKYRDIVVTKTVNAIMESGKKSTAERALYDAFAQVEQKTTSNPIEMFRKALSNLRPVVEVRSRRVGGANYQVPTEVRAERAQALAIRWLIQGANGRGERKIADRLAGEIMDAANGRGNGMKKKEDTHKMAEANKAFAHFKW